MIELKGFGNAIRIKRGEQFEKSEMLNIRGAKGERVSFQLYFRTDKAGGAELSLSSVTDEKGHSVEIKTRLYFETFVPILQTSCSPFTHGEYADGIIEYVRAKELGLLNLEADKDYAALVTVAIPEECSGSLNVYAELIQGGERAVLPITITPYNFSLPAQNHSKTAFLIWEDQNMILGSPTEQKRKYAELYEMLLDFRVCGGKLPRDDDSVEAFIRAAKKYALDERVASYSVCYKSKRVDMEFRKNEEVLDIDYCRELLTAMVNSSTDECNLFEKAYFYITFIDEPMPDKFPSVRRCYQEIHDLKREIAKVCDFSGRRKVEASLLTMDNIVTTFQKEEIYGEVDAWCPTFWAYSYAEYRYEESRLRHLGKKNWWYGCMSPVHPWPNLHTDAPLTDGRIESWMRYEKDIAGNLYWCVNYHFKYDVQKGMLEKDLLDDAKCCASSVGDGVLIYTETRYGKPFPTLRLNALCESAKDYEYLLMFDSLSKELGFFYESELKPRELLADLFRSMFDHTLIMSDYRAVEYAKSELAGRIEAARQGVICRYECGKRGGILINVYSPDGMEITVDGGKKLSAEAAGKGVKQTFEINSASGLIVVRYRTGNKENVLSLLAAQAKKLDISALSVKYGEAEVSDCKEGKLVRIKPFVNSDPPKLTMPCKANLSDANYIYCQVQSLCDYECILHINLMDSRGKRYSVGYEVAEENRLNGLYFCINKYTEKQLSDLSIIKIEKTWEHDKAQAEILEKFRFDEITAIEFIPLNNVKLLDNNRERRVSGYDLIIKEVRAERIKQE